MKKIGIIISLILILFFISGVGTLYYRNLETSKTEEVQMCESEKTFRLFVDALNQNHIATALEYVEPTEAQLIKFAINKADELTGNKIVKVFSKWFPFLSDFIGLDVIPELSPQIITVDESEETSVITVTLNTNDTVSFYDVYLIKIEEKWFIQYAKKVKAAETNEVI